MNSVRSIIAMTAIVLSYPAMAEYADYGSIELNGLARETSWGLNAPGESYAMVCNVNGPDGFLSVRADPGADHSVKRSLKRLATVTVDTNQRQGNWVRVLDAHRDFSEDGRPAEYKPLTVEGWAHDGYLCSFIDYPEPGAFDVPAESVIEGNASSSRSEFRLAQASSNEKLAQCEWDNGMVDTPETYACEFNALDDDGSFSVIRADTYELMLTIERPGVGTLQEYAEGRALLNYGTFYRSESDRACWASETGDEKLCAR